jgi:2-polyprenyl-6-methoxyphenol hydroxylase-like FAD-dependent oxidoreductase
MRIAIVGGGAAGLSSALHLAPLIAQGHISGPIDIFDGGNAEKREIGVGIWSTALDPFRKSTEDSHQLVIDEMTKCGSYVRDVGYRTPKGHWLALSRLGGHMPDLLFIREMDMLEALRKAVQLEEKRGTIKLHSGSDYHVRSISEESEAPWSAPLKIGADATDSERDYHFIVGADGMNSTIRKMYGGHVDERSRLTGMNALTGPLDSPDKDEMVTENWHTTGQSVATSTQDRNYTVFRGNAHLSPEDIGLDRSFQTWGEGQSMRFATVPMSYPSNDGDGTKREEREVWFITIDSDDISNETDPTIRREKLLEGFKDWHEPIRTLVEATPAEEILMERAMAHKHSMAPVANFNEIVTRIRNKAPPSRGNGPAIAFIGDAFMCVDPILAQGFTFGLEGAAALKRSLETSLLGTSKIEYPPLAFDPVMLRQELKGRHDNRLQRLICLLRATEMVQALGQPTTGTLAGFVSRDVIRPLMRLTPGFIKTPVFNAVLKYSLGLPQSFDNSKEQ